MKYLSNTASLELFRDRCVGCGMCIDVCPHGVFFLKDGRASISDRDRCMECGACLVNCAFGAIGVDKGVGCASAVINSMITGGEPSCGCSGKDNESTCC